MSGPRELLSAYVLGLLGREERAEVARALAADPALEAERDEIARHLALYERFPAPADPPAFARVERLLDRPPAPSRPWLRAALAAAALAAAALVLVGLGVGRLVGSRDGSGGAPFLHTTRLGPGLTLARSAPERGVEPEAEPGVAHEGGLLSADVPAEALVGARVRAVLDAGARLALVSDEDVRLERGRAYFEVRPGPFRVETAHGAVQVVGTRFEVDLREGLEVNVSEGRVRVGALEIGPGQRLRAGVVSPALEPAGAFFRRPLLRVEGPGSSPPGETLLLRLVLENPTQVRQEIAGPETVATGALLTFTDPSGRVETRGLDFAQALSGGFEALKPVVLGPRERRMAAFHVRLPAGPPGSWRLAALYRPEGEAPLASEPLALEVR